MAAKYMEYLFRVTPKVPGNEILIAELAEKGFESFMEKEDELLAYIPINEAHELILEDLAAIHSSTFKITYDKREIEQQNWNQQWENNFQPIMIDDRCTIRASFHPKSKAAYDILINPKMAFGTGHHATTYMMIQYLLEEDLGKKTVLDMGCGTGVLAILAEKRGATRIDAIDTDSWCYENTVENSLANRCKLITVRQGDSRLLQPENYDFILANINRNVLLKDMEKYSRSLLKNGTLSVSGFYEEDLKMIKRQAEKYSLKFLSNKKKDKWIAAKFITV